MDAEAVDCCGCLVVDVRGDEVALGTGGSTLDFRHMRALIVFFEYNPLSGAATLRERLVRCRTSLGMSQKEAAREIGVDPATLARWERGEREPTGAHLTDVRRFLDGDSRKVRRAG